MIANSIEFIRTDGRGFEEGKRGDPMNAANLKSNTGRKLGKYLLIAGVIGAIAIIILVLTGKMTWKDLIQIHQKLIEICPFCM